MIGRGGVSVNRHLVLEGCPNVRLAVVGAGITGLSAAWLLGSRHDVVLFEADGRLGGHANTVEVASPEGPLAVDTGFIVYNTQCYPNLIALFERLKVPTAATEMSFAVSLDAGAYEYSGSGLGTMFGQRRNIARPSHWRMTADILRFFKEASALDPATLDPEVTLGAWLAAKRYSDSFIKRHIVPMGSAIWSAPGATILDFPFAAFVRFFSNHGLLQVSNRPQWRTVKGGSRAYVERIRAAFTGQISLGDPVQSVKGFGRAVEIKTRAGRVATFDGVIVACHADDAVQLTGGEDAETASVLSAFRYQSNEAVLHTDARAMPKRKRVWASWNYLGQESTGRAAVTYWMNRLQPLATATGYFVSLNPPSTIAEDQVLGRYSYAHPLFDTAAINAQRWLWDIQGKNRIWFAGSYFGYGFHEDGLQAGLAAAEDLSVQLGGGEGRVTRPWDFDRSLSRIAKPPMRAAAPLKVCA